jgi:ParB-like chromosome segregation protein Spo0J
MKVKVRDVHPNPYRNIEHYPLNKEKIMALTKSIEKTGFWDNLVGREVDGQIQIAYGHHRIEALRLAEGFGYDFEFELPVKNIDNGTMIQIMANENMQEWSHSIGVVDETVKVAKEYLELGDRSLTSKKTHKNTVSVIDISEFLGWNLNKVKESVKRLKLINDGTIQKEAVQSLPTETHAIEFANAINTAKEKKNIEFTPQEQKAIVKEIIDRGLGKRDVKKTIEAKVFEKKYGDDFGKKKAEAVDKKLQEFDNQLGFIANDISSLSDKFLKLTSLKNELESVTSKKGLFNLKILLMAFGNLKTRMQKFEESMLENTEDITIEYIEEVKQLNQ